MTGIKPIHPFPARMAPEIVLKEVQKLPPSSLVLDPMTGSGTVARVASDAGHRVHAFDMDPLAVMMTKAWTTPVDAYNLVDYAKSLVAHAKLLPHETPLHWIDSDVETSAFIDFWFASQQKQDLRKLAFVLSGMSGARNDVMKIALSRIIITKDRGASLARDVSHSRPHRVRITNDFDVMEQFLRSVEHVSKRLCEQPPLGQVETCVGDARDLNTLHHCQFDVVITSPPYLNAIDYMRGHRLSLVWLGYTLQTLRGIRSGSIGAELPLANQTDTSIADEITSAMEGINNLPVRERKMFDRYVLDIYKMVSEIHRILKANGMAILVVGNSRLRDVFVENSLAVVNAGQLVGLQCTASHQREIPPSRRYLPSPTHLTNSDLQKRMRTETVLTMTKQ